MKEVKFTRQELYDLVWAESMLTLAKKYDISDVGLRKKCNKLEIPIPNAGYWAKVKYGKKVVAKRPLGNFKGEQVAILYLREEIDEKSIDGQILHSELQKEIECDKRLNLRVPEKLINPNKLIVDAKEDIYKKEVWNKAEGIAYTSPGVLSIRVSPNNIGRALRYMDTLIKALIARGHDIEIKNGGSYINVFGEAIGVVFKEGLKREVITDQWGTHSENQANGLLSFKLETLYPSKRFADGKIPLEEQLSRIIAFLELTGKKLKEERMDRERKQKAREEKERIAKELQLRKEKELVDFKELFKKVKRHDKAEAIRRYADERERYANETNNLTNIVKAEVSWIRKKADWYDPFIEAEDELFMDVDREELNFKKRNWWG
ncbi:MAG: hypothetical protein Q7U54_00230 [Bacteroidales bacterium]|nr:hypothetical protein [Bacteroidales bacterium]